jgi:hypothetical protein
VVGDRATLANALRNGPASGVSIRSSRAECPARTLNGKYRASFLVCTIEIALSETKGGGPQNK